jgi:predicted RecB family endonuclease
LFEAAAGINHDCSPVIEFLAVAIGIDADFAIESLLCETHTEETSARFHPLIEKVVFLELDFAEVDIASVIGGQKYTIDAEAGFFDFNRIKGIASRVCGWIRDEIE